MNIFWLSVQNDLENNSTCTMKEDKNIHFLMITPCIKTTFFFKPAYKLCYLKQLEKYVPRS